LNAILVAASIMAFVRPLDYFENRFHDLQEDQWVAYKAGLDLVLPWGRRSGKSDFFADVLIEDVEDYGKPNLYLASTQVSAREIMWPKFKERIKKLPDTWALQDARLEAIYKPTDTPVRFRGIENVDDLAGKAYRIVICDEYALWKKKNQKVSDIIKLIIAPMVVDYGGQIFYGSSKRGKNHFYDLHERAKKNPQKYFVNECTMFDNPFVSPEGRTRVIAEYDGPNDPLLRQEINNEYVTFQGMVFALEPESYTEKRWDPADLDHSYHVRGVDHGYSPDPTACVWLAYNNRKGHWIVYSEYKKSELLIKQHADVILGNEPYPIAETISDVDPQVIAEYEAVGLSMEPAGKYDKQARLLRLVNALTAGRLKIATNCTQLLKEMASYEWEQDGDDHLIDALIYAFTNANPPEIKREEPEEDDPRLTARPPVDHDSQDFG
jgi:phage terminase large subunit